MIVARWFKNLPLWKKLMLVFIVSAVTVPIVGHYLRPQLAVVPTLEEKWRVSGLANPESVVYDPLREVLYVSNVNGDPLAKDGNGSIARVSKKGELLEPLITGLNGPKGIAIVHDLLYVADIDKVLVIDIETANIKTTYEIPDAGFLNDIAITGMTSRGVGKLREVEDGAFNYINSWHFGLGFWGIRHLVFVSDTFKDRIYLIDPYEILEEQRIRIATEGAPFIAPNGLYMVKEHWRVKGKRSRPFISFLIGSWGERTEGFETSQLGSLLEIPLDGERDIEFENINTDNGKKYAKRVHELTKDLGNLDGIDSYAGGHYIVSDWVAGKIYHIDSVGRPSLLASPGKGSADLFIDVKNDTLYVPMMLDNTLIAYKINKYE